MACPDEDTFAHFVEGLLPPAAAADIERHVDGCARCADLAAEFGSLYAEPTAAARAPGRLRTWALLAAVVLHAAWALVLRLWPGALDALPLPVSLAPATAAYRLYSAIWAPLGGAVALLAALGVARGQSWARPLALGHALLSLPSVVLTPLAVFVIAVMRRRDSRQRDAS